MWPGAGRAEVASSPWPVASPQPNSPWNRAKVWRPETWLQGRDAACPSIPHPWEDIILLCCRAAVEQGRGEEGCGPGAWVCYLPPIQLSSPLLVCFLSVMAEHGLMPLP